MTFFFKLNFRKKNDLKYRPEIDGLRALAVLPVILFHADFEIISGGFTGVDVFFVISGYLITSIIIQDIDKKKFSITNFYERRARRILPVLYLVTISTLVVSYFILTPKNLISLANSSISIPFFSSNFYFWSERGYFDDDSVLKPLIHTWSLSVEEQFYIVFPIILLILYNYKKTLYIFLSVGFFLSLFFSYYLTLIHFDTAFYFPITRAWELLAGAFCGIFLYKTSLRIGLYFAEILSFLGLTLIFYSYITFNNQTLFPYISALIPVVGCMLFIIASQNSYLVKKIFSNKIIVYIGLISYSLYLWHHSIFSLTRHLDIFEKNKLILIIISFILSILTYHSIERRFRNKFLIKRKFLIYFVIVGTIIIMTIGLIYKTNNGIPSRYSYGDQILFNQLASTGNYNQKYFDENEFKQFSLSKKHKIVIIGDSTAKDFFNIIKESNQFADYEFSTRQINSECGNLFLKNYDTIEKFIPENRLARCNFLGRYEGKKFNKILKDADEIWIVSLWENWTIEFIPISLENLNYLYKKPIRIFGIKNFGNIDIKSIIKIEQKERPKYKQSIRNSALNTSTEIDNILKNYPLYYPLMDKLCGGNKKQCKIFTPDGLLISNDGWHLTQEGAIEGAKRIQDVLLNIKKLN